ncbi:MAG: hypothetical protein CMI36_07845 [Owenweeksia sp.]|nr:hypothetical protein [Owenweeksia sp.]MBF98888.1 hypothetical protein [Owenweeksia sp.]HCQ14788.1 hypothetical protein [Cryomorphaceae bacterium]|tara:strand:+ start:1640 stop:2875 length:1236 start_codon:yes stop_codon:yes gene_type:complete
MKTILYQIALGLIFLAACRKNDPVPIPPDPGPEQKLEYVWSSYLPSDSLVLYTSIDPQINNGAVLFSTTNGSSEIVKSFNKLTGELNWEWSDNNYQRNYLNNENALLVNNVLFLGAKHTIYAINAANGSTRWTYTWPAEVYGDIYLYTDGQYLYHRIMVEHPKLPAYDAYIMRTPVDATAPQWDTVFIDPADTHSKRFKSLNFFTRTDGHEMMVGVVDAAGIEDGVSGKTSLFLYDLTAENLVYYKDNAMPNGAFLNPLQLDQDKVYVLGGWAVHAFDLQTGEEVWTYQHATPGDPNRSFASGDLLLYKGNIVAKNRDGIMVMLDATNGKKVWSLSETGSNLGGRLRIFKDYAYFTSSNNLMVVNLSLGELLINERPPSGNWAEGTVAIDETNNLLFYNDRVSGFCAKIPE